MDILESGIGELIQPFDMDEFREWNRTQKSRKLVDKRMSESEAINRFVQDGCYIGTELYGTVRAPMSLAVLSLLLAAPATADEAALARRLVERIEQRHSSTRDLVARFVQAYRSGMLGREVVEKGTVSIKRPGRMHWEYREPERKVFVSDGRVFYFYVPADRQVIIQEQDTERSLAARLLSGRGGLLECRAGTRGCRAARARAP